MFHIWLLNFHIILCLRHGLSLFVCVLFFFFASLFAVCPCVLTFGLVNKPMHLSKICIQFKHVCDWGLVSFFRYDSKVSQVANLPTLQNWHRFNGLQLVMTRDDAI